MFSPVLTRRVRLFCCKFWVEVSRFSLCVINLVEESCCEMQSSGLLWATNFGFVARFSSNSQLVLDPHQANEPVNALHFFNPRQMFLLRDKLITRGEKRETLTQNLQRTMLRDKMRVFVTLISSPLTATSYTIACISFESNLLNQHHYDRSESLSYSSNWLKSASEACVTCTLR